MAASTPQGLTLLSKAPAPDKPQQLPRLYHLSAVASSAGLAPAGGSAASVAAADGADSSPPQKAAASSGSPAAQAKSPKAEASEQQQHQSPPPPQQQQQQQQQQGSPPGRQIVLDDLNIPADWRPTSSPISSHSPSALRDLPWSILSGSCSLY